MLAETKYKRGKNYRDPPRNGSHTNLTNSIFQHVAMGTNSFPACHCIPQNMLNWLKTRTAFKKTDAVLTRVIGGLLRWMHKDTVSADQKNHQKSNFGVY